MPARKSPRVQTVFDYDVCLSFAGEDRRYVDRVAATLRRRGVRVFYDDYERVDLWGKELYAHLDDVYRNAARFCVLFVSKHYARKLWTNHERQSAQARAFRDHVEYILPARFDDTDAPGLRPTIGFIDLRKLSPAKFADLIVKKVGVDELSNFLPPIPDKLYKRIGARNENEKARIHDDAWEFVKAVKRMDEEERATIFNVLIHGCRAELPENIHINIDLLRRTTKFTVGKLKRILGRLHSLGFYTTMREDTETAGRLGKLEMAVLEWHNMTVIGDGNATAVLFEMVECVCEGRCEACAEAALSRLDFSSLATVTTRPHKH